MSNPSYKASRVVIAFAAFVMMGSGIAVAGMRFPAEVVVFNRGDGSGIAEGSLGSARNSTDTNPIHRMRGGHEKKFRHLCHLYRQG